MSAKQTLTLTSAVVSVFLLAACQSTGSMVRSGGGDTVIKTPQGQTISVSQTATLPANFPLPAYPGAKTSSAVSASQQVAGASGSDSASVVLETEDSPAKVQGFYESQLKNNGWTISNQVTINQMCTIQAKKEKQMANIVATGVNGGKTSIALSVISKLTIINK